MEISRSTGNSQTLIAIAGECTIYTAAEARARLLDDVSGLQQPVQLDLKGVTEIDTAGVQLLLMLQKNITAAGGTLSLQGVSPGAAQVFATLCLPAPFASQELETST